MQPFAFATNLKTHALSNESGARALVFCSRRVLSTVTAIAAAVAASAVFFFASSCVAFFLFVTQIVAHLIRPIVFFPYAT